MSLFGDPRSATSPDSSPLQSRVDEDEVDRAAEPDAVRASRDFDTFIEDALEQADSNENVANDYSNLVYHQTDRPNRFRGTARQWRRLTEEERGLAASLDQLRVADLSIHLYNASRLKRDRTDEQHDWVPPSAWTAWPVTPDLVPQPHEHFGVPANDPLFRESLNEHPAGPAHEVQEQLQALLQKQSKQQWEAEGGLINRTASPDSASARASIRDDLVVLADDDEARQILRPTINSVLAKIDKLLFALHHSRHSATIVADALHQEVTSIAGASQRETTQRMPGLPTRSRSRNNAGSVARSRSTGARGRPRRYDKHEDESYYQMQKRLARERSRGRSASGVGLVDDAPRLPEDGYYYGYYKRLAGGDRGPEQNEDDLEARTPTEVRKGSRRIQPRDWSEVLNMAAQQGFDADAVKRAAERCSELFSERMLLRSIGHTSRAAVEEPPAAVEQNETQDALSPESRKRRRQHLLASEAEQSLACPIVDCSWHTRTFASRRRRDEHVLKLHGREALTQHAPEDMMVDGVHLDGFLQVISP